MVLRAGSHTVRFVDETPSDPNPALISPWSETADLAALGAALTHTLREPIHAIRLFNGALEMRVPAEAESTREIDRAARSLADVFRELEQYLCAPRATASWTTAEQLDAVVGGIVERLRASVTVRCTAQDAGIRGLWLDDESVERVVEEVVDNAVRHGRGERGLEWALVDGEPCVRVWDEGPGFPAEIGARVFLPLVCGVGKGPGLGLAWVNRCIHQVDGSVRAARNDGRFTVSICFGGSDRV